MFVKSEHKKTRNDFWDHVCFKETENRGSTLIKTILLTFVFVIFSFAYQTILLVFKSILFV